ncbi:MAG: hypothetical protein JNG90_19285 [Planctomycetaceae bacterium]|nr:hypothetical protein [Planctomycetaceae bacterium]
MTDRFARICVLSFAAVGLTVAVGGCNQSRPQSEAPAPTVAEHTEPPRLFPQGAFDAPMDVPLTLAPNSAPADAAPPRTTLRDPASAGDFAAAAPGLGDPETAASENLLIPPSDRALVVEGAEDAPLPELLPFETSPALAEHAGTAPADELTPAADAEATEAFADEPQVAESAAPVAAAPEVEEVADHAAGTADTTAPQLPSPESVAMTDATDEATAAATPEETPEVEPSAPLASTGTLSINKVKSIDAAERNVARLEVPSGNGAAEPSASQPAEPTVAPPAAVAVVPERAPEIAASQPQPSQQAVAPAPVAPQPQPQPAASPAAELAITTPPAQASSEAVTQPVAPLKAQAAPEDVVATPALPRATVAAPPVKHSVPTSPAAKPTTSAPPASVAVTEQDETITRSPLPAQPIPPQPALLAHSEHDPSGQAAIRLAPSSAPATPRPLGDTTRSPAVRKPALQPERVAVQAPPAIPAPVAAAPHRAPAPAQVARQPVEAAAPRDRALPVPDRAPPMRSAELIAVSRLADEHSRRAFDLATRNAMYSARAEFIEALQIVAHAIDAEERSTEHSQALADGLTAIKESDDFASQGGRLQDNIDVIRIAKPHTTPVLKGLPPNSVSRLAAMQQYYTYAQRRLAFAAGREPSGSLALYGLGKLHSVLAQQPVQGIASAEPKAIVYHQAALLVDGRNYMAANDLGVLLARYGKFQQAKAALLHSLEVSPQPATWQNLTVVHQQLGEVRLAQLAQAESKAAQARVKQLARSKGQSMTANATVVWLDPATFSQSSEMWAPPTPNGQPQPSAPANTPTTASKPAGPPAPDAPRKGFFRQ